MVVWAVCIGGAILLFVLTGRWMFRDYKRTKVLTAPIAPHACEVKLDEAETLMDKKMTELRELHDQSLKGVKFDPKTYVPPPQTPIDAQAAELQKMLKPPAKSGASTS